MDTKEDFKFLIGCIAEQYNPYQENEYLVIQSCSGNLRLAPIYRSFDYRVAENFREIENLGSDYQYYVTRVVHQGKLYYVGKDGAPISPSYEQDWKIHEEYYNARFVEDLDCEIEICSCSYPIFWNYGACISSDGEASVIWRPITCLVEYNGREVDKCPNCGASLTGGKVENEKLWEEEENWDEAPEPCRGCKYYSSDYFIACAVHPYGPLDDICPDYSI